MMKGASSLLSQKENRFIISSNFLFGVYLVTLFVAAVGGWSSFEKHTVHYIEGQYAEDNVVAIDANTEYILAFPNKADQVEHPIKVSTVIILGWESKLWNWYFDWSEHLRLQTPNPYRISAYSGASNRFPALIVIRQEKQVLSWQIPMIVSTSLGEFKFRNTSRTLCFSSDEMMRRVLNVDTSEEVFARNFSVSISTSSSIPITVTVRADEYNDYFIENDKDYLLTISPSQPVFFYYRFPEDDDKMSSALIEVDSEDEVCLTVSVQRSLCPVRDLNKDIEYEGDFQTINLKGAIMVRERLYPDGFFLVFVAKGDNFDCGQESSLLPMPRRRQKHVIALNRTSQLQFNVRKGLAHEQYIAAVMVVFGIYFGFCVLFMSIVVIIYYCKRKHHAVDHDEPVDDGPAKNTDYVDSYLDKEDFTVEDFIMARSRIQKRSFNYLWHIMNIGLFYGIPVVQLMVSYQRTVNLTGDLNKCYHNFLCAHPFLGVSDFNHIYSNIGYMILGVLLFFVTLFRHRKDNRHPKYGIPTHYGLFYAMGIGLILEGIFSACYHVCPNQSNYQFDTSFMYVMAVLCIIKLYQNRHPSINASAYATFTVIGIAVFVAMVGILTNSTAMMLLFVISYMAMCLYLSFKIYFFGYVLKGCMHFVEFFKQGHSVVESLYPIRKGLFVLLLLANLCNMAMAVLGIIFYPSYTDFGTYLLMIVMGNSILHAMFYVAMKLFHKERIRWEAAIYGTLAILSWGSSAYFFFNASTQWTVTPAESRQLNTNCIFMEFFDHHDVWHMLSAPALFFSFMMLMNLDDDLDDTHQSKIKVF